MKTNPLSILRLALVVSVTILALGGCSDDSVTAPEADTTTIAADPLDDALKSMDEPAPVDAAARIDRLAEALGLDEQQVADLTAAYDEFRAGLADLRTQVRDGDLTVEEAREAALVLREAFEAELQVILTPEQWDQLQEMRDEGRQRDRDRAGDRDRDRDRDHDGRVRPVERWTAMLEEIGADEGQIDDVLAALEVFMTGVREVRDAVSEGTFTCEEAKETVAALRDDFDAALQEILTEDQYAALLALRPDCDGRNGR